MAIPRDNHPRDVLADMKLDRKLSRPCHSEVTGSVCVLAVAGSEANLRILRRILEREGYCVVVSSSSHETLRLLHGARTLPDAVIVDNNLPGTDSLDLCASIRARWGRETFPLIFLGSSVGGKGRPFPADACLQKPVRAHELSAALTIQLLARETLQLLSAAASGLPEHTAFALGDHQSAVAGATPAAGPRRRTSWKVDRRHLVKV